MLKISWKSDNEWLQENVLETNGCKLTRRVSYLRNRNCFYLSRAPGFTPRYLVWSVLLFFLDFYVVFLSCLVCLRTVSCVNFPSCICPMLPVSLDCAFLIATLFSLTFIYRVRVMMFNATFSHFFSNIAAVSVFGEGNRSQTNFIIWAEFELTTLVVIGTDGYLLVMTFDKGEEYVLFRCLNTCLCHLCFVFIQPKLCILSSFALPHVVFHHVVRTRLTRIRYTFYSVSFYH